MLRIVRPEHLEAGAIFLLVDVALCEALRESRFGRSARRTPGTGVSVAAHGVPARPAPATTEETEQHDEDDDPEERDEQEQEAGPTAPGSAPVGHGVGESCRGLSECRKHDDSFPSRFRR